MTPAVRVVPLAGGTKIAVREYGDPDGLPLMHLPGCGTAGSEQLYAQDFLQRAGIRLIGIDRPGFGESTPQPLTFKELAAALLDLANAMGLKRFAVGGMSAGAPYALHVAQLAPQRVRAVILINPSAEKAHPAGRRIPLIYRATNRLLTGWPFSGLTARYIKNNTAGFVTRAARKQGMSAAETALTLQALQDGLAPPRAAAAFKHEAQRVLNRPWGVDWAALRPPVLALCGEGDFGRHFYDEIRKTCPVLQLEIIGGGHSPVIAEDHWRRIAGFLRAA